MKTKRWAWRIATGLGLILGGWTMAPAGVAAQPFNPDWFRPQPPIAMAFANRLHFGSNYHSGYCTNQSQECDARLAFRVPRFTASATTRVLFVAPPSHCTEVRYVITDEYDRWLLLRTPWLQPGHGTWQNMAPGQGFFVRAEGRLGGCNTGYISAWGIDIRVQTPGPVVN